MSPVASYLITASAAIILLLGLVHLLYTFSGPKLLPRDRELQAKMEMVSPVISPRTSMWKAWIGFNASHSLGAIFFGAVYGYLSLVHAAFLFQSAFLVLLGLLLLLAYLFLGKRYWFSIPFRGILAATVLYATAMFSPGRSVRDTQLIEDLRLRFNAGEQLEYVFFWGHRPGRNGITASCFSQWYSAPFVVDGERYPTAEHYMMAEKAALFGDLETRAQVLQAPDPVAAKALGRRVRGFDETTWVQQRFSIVIRANSAKFAQNPELDRFLGQTGSRVLVEASPVDRIWGIGLAQDDEKAGNPNSWRGLNLLGFSLMRVRDGG